MTPEVRQQAAELRAFLRSCCAVCGLPHDEELHAAVLRVRESLLPVPIQQPVMTTKPSLMAGPTGTICDTCGESFMGVRAKRCLKCGEGVKIKQRKEAAARQKSKKKRKLDGNRAA